MSVGEGIKVNGGGGARIVVNTLLSSIGFKYLFEFHWKKLDLNLPLLYFSVQIIRWRVSSWNLSSQKVEIMKGPRTFSNNYKKLRKNTVLVCS